MFEIVLVAAATLLASFLCSLFEAVLYSVSRAQVELLRQRGGRGGRLAKLKRDVEEPIAAILTVNTIAHTIGSAWCGAMVGAHYDSTAVGIFAAVFTLLVLVLTEIIPKSIGVRKANLLAPWVAWPIQWMVWLAYPVARPARQAMRFFAGSAGHAGPSEEELILFSGLAAQHGGVRRDEHRWVTGALRLDKVLAGDLRTPRTVVETRPAEQTVAAAAADFSNWVHSRVPVLEEGDVDRVVGIVFRREVLDAALAGKDSLTLRDLMHPIGFVPETLPAHVLLARFLTERRHLFAVADEYGGFEGIVTLEDVLECLLGTEIVDEHDEHDDMQVMARDRNPHESGEPQPDPATG